MLLVNEANVAYTAGADLALTATKWCTAAGVITTPPGTVKLQFMVRLKSDAIMYLRSQSDNGAVLSAATLTAAQGWITFETLWAAHATRTFSVRFSASQANLFDLVINAVVNEGGV